MYSKCSACVQSTICAEVVTYIYAEVVTYICAEVVTYVCAEVVTYPHWVNWARTPDPPCIVFHLDFEEHVWYDWTGRPTCLFTELSHYCH